MSSELARVLIEKTLGEYLGNIDSNNIAVGLWSGFVKMENVIVKPSAFDKFNLPLKIVFGKVDKIEMSIPYKSILMGISASVDIFIDNIKIYTKSNGRENWDFFDYTDYDYKKSLIKSFTEDLLVRIKISENPKINNTYVNRMVNNIIDNIKIKINNFIVIHEDLHSHNNFNFHVGVQCKEISIMSKESLGEMGGMVDTNTNANTEYTKIAKEFKLLEFSLFLIPIEKNEKVVYEFAVGNNLILKDLYVQLETNSANFSSDKDSKKDSNKDSNQMPKEFNIINPINLTMDLRRNSGNSKYKLDIQIDSIEIELERKQFACILKCLDFINNYTQFYNNCYFYRRLKFFKPELTELENEYKQNLTGNFILNKKINLNLNSPQKQNLNIKKTYSKQFLKHYFTAVHKLIKEKKHHKPFLNINEKLLLEFKNFFTKTYTKFYLHETSLNYDQFKKIKEIIKFVDTEVLYDWIKEVVAEIYTQEKKTEQKSGFFGGIKSFFYQSAIDSIKYDESILENVKPDELIFNLNLKISQCALSISERRIRSQNNKIKETSKFIIKDFTSVFNKTETTKEDSFVFNLQVNEFKMSSVTKMNESSFINDIIIPLQKFSDSDSDKIFIMNIKKEVIITTIERISKPTYVFINLFSQAFIYNQNVIENVSRFLNIAEFDQISNYIKTTDLLPVKFDLDALQKYNNEGNTSDISEITDLTVIVNNQKLIFPFKSQEASLLNDLIILNMGDFTIKNNENYSNSSNNENNYSHHSGQIYKAESKKIKIEYEKSFTDYINKIKIKSPQINDSKSSFDILNEFSFNLTIDLINMKFQCNFSDINFNLSNKIILKLISFPEIFTINYESDIWESVYENKAHIFNNSSKRGAIMLKEKSNLFADKWKKYFCLLSGGYLYLFEKPDNLKADVLISLTNAEVTEGENKELKEEGVDNPSPNPNANPIPNEFFTLNVVYNTRQSSLTYTLGLSSENHMKDWKKAISNRIEEIRSYSSEKDNFPCINHEFNSDNVIDSSFVFVNTITDTITDTDKDSLDKFKAQVSHNKNLEKMKNILNLFKNQNQEKLKNKLNFEFTLKHLGLNILLNKNNKNDDNAIDVKDVTNATTPQENYLLEFKNFNLIIKVNELLLLLNFELSSINLKHTLIIPNNINNPQVNTDILSNKLSLNEKLMHIKIIVYNSDIFNFISNPDFINFDKILSQLNAEDRMMEYIKNLSKVDIEFSLSNMTLLFNPKIIQNLYKFIIDIVNITEKENDALKEEQVNVRDRDINFPKGERDFSTESSSVVSEKFKTSEKITSNMNAHPLLKLSAIFKSLDLIIINKKTNLKFFSFSLGESVFDLIQFFPHLQVKLNFGNFQINEHSNFPNNLNNLNNVDNIENIPNFKYPEREILGLANKHKNSSLFVDIIIYNKDFSPLVDGVKVTMKLHLTFESIKVNFVYKIIMRFIDCVLYDIVPVFDSEEAVKEIVTKEIDTKDQLKIQQKQNINTVIETFELNIQINNPTIVLFDVKNETLYYQLDFGKIYVKNSISKTTSNVDNVGDNVSRFYYERYEIDFKDTNITSCDKFNICQPLSTSIVLSFRQNLIPNANISAIDSDQSILESLPETEVKIYVKVFDFKIRKQDYINILKIVKNNFQLDDGNDNLLFDYVAANATNENIPTNIPNNNPSNNLIFSLNFFNEIFKIKILNESHNYIHLFLTECDFNTEKFLTNMQFRISSKNIFVKDNTISVISNIKGLDKSINMKNYAQFNLTYKDDYILNEAFVDLSLIDVKFLLKLDLVNFLLDFINININVAADVIEEVEVRKKEENIGENIVEVEVNKTNAEKENIKNTFDTSSNSSNKKTSINIAILNNLIFLKSQNHFSAQEILACEGDIIAKVVTKENNELVNINITSNKFEVEQDKIKYEIIDKFEVNFALQNLFVYTAEILSFESDFENIYNKRKLFEPINLYANIINRAVLNLNLNLNINPIKSSNFDKTEILFEIDSIKMKVSYRDLFFIFNTITLNINNIIGEEKTTQEKEKNEGEGEFPSKKESADDNNINNNSEHKFENSLEVFLNLKSVDIFLINDLNDMFCPILQLMISHVDSTFFLGRKEEINMKLKSDILVNYFNYKISIWEPLIEKFDVVFLKRSENTFINIKSSLNCNITEEFIFLLKNSIECFKINYKKETSASALDDMKYLRSSYLSEDLRSSLVSNNNNNDLRTSLVSNYNSNDLRSSAPYLDTESKQEELNVSNHILINYSGDTILIRKNLLDGSTVEVKIKNGDCYDVNNIFKWNHYYSLDSDFILASENVFDEVTFENKKLTIKIFYLNPSNDNHNGNSNSNSNNNAAKSEKLFTDQINTLISNDIFYIVELNKIRRNYIFYPKILLENHTDMKLFLNYTTERSEVKPNGCIGFEKDEVSQVYLSFSFNKNLKEKESCYKLNYKEILNQGNLHVDLGEYKCSINVTKYEIQYLTFKNEILRMKIHPTFIIENFLSYDIGIIRQSLIESERERINIKPSQKKFLYCGQNLESNESNLNLESNLDLFKYEIGEGNNLYRSVEIVDMTENNNHTVNNNNNNNNNNDNLQIPSERTQLLTFRNAQNKEKSFKLKLNYIKEHGVIKLFLYSDYLIINPTPFNIFPLIDTPNNPHPNLSSEKVKFRHNFDNQVFCDYYSVPHFDSLQLNLIDNNFPDKLFTSELIQIVPENYAFVKGVELVNPHVINDGEFYQIVLERYIKYVKFTALKKIDMLLIKPKYVIKNNLDYDIILYTKVDTGANKTKFNKMIKRHSEEIVHCRNSLINFRIIHTEKDEEDYNLDLNKNNNFYDYSYLTNETELINLDKHLLNQIILNKNAQEAFYITILNEISGFTSQMTITETNNSNSLIIMENKSEQIIKLYQVTKDSDDYKNEMTLYPNQSKFFNWTKMFISKYIKIDIVDISNNKSKDYYVLEYDRIANNNNNNNNCNFVHRFSLMKDFFVKVNLEGNVQKFYFDQKSHRTANNKNIKNNKNNNLIQEKQDTGLTLIKILSQLLININEINICIVNYDYKVKNQRTELLNLNISKVSVILVEEIRNNKDKYQTLELKLKNLQLDNLSHNVTPYKVNIFKVFEVEGNGSLDAESPLIHFLTEIKSIPDADNIPNKTFTIEKLEFLIQSFGVCLDSEFLFEILKFTKSLQIDPVDSLHYNNVSEILDVVIKANLLKDSDFSNINSSDNKNLITINYLRTSPINLLLSYKNLSDKLFDELNIKSSLIKNIIDVFTSNDKVNIQLKAIEMHKVFGNRDQIVDKIIQYYYYNLISQSLKLFFSIDILGNPLNFLQNLQSGVKDFFFLPAQGIINGPFEFIYGSISGTKSLVSHTIGGALDSTEKIASSLGKNLLKLSNSEDYIKERESIYLNPASKLNKFSTSLKIIFLGIKYAARDFIFLPYFYLKNQGILFLPKGIFLGLTSIFVKPVSGVLDFLSFFSADLSKRFLHSYESTFHNLKRKRPQRVFWGVNHYIRNNDVENDLVDKMINSFDLSQGNYFDSLFAANTANTDIYYNFNCVVKKVIFFKAKMDVPISEDQDAAFVHAALFINDVMFIVNVPLLKVLKVIPVCEIQDLITDSYYVKVVFTNRKLRLLSCEHEMKFDEEEIKDNFLNYVLLVWNRK